MEQDNKKIIEEIKAFEEGFPDGIYATPTTKKVKVRALINYCKKEGISIDSLDEKTILELVEKVDEYE